MESRLHRQIKERYGPLRGGRSEVVVAGFRIDAIGPDDELIEVQSGSLGPLRGKLDRLLSEGRRVRVVKPVVLRRRIVRRARPGGPDLSARFSPRRGSALDLFDDLVGIAHLLPHPDLAIDAVEVHVEEIRVRRRRRDVTLDRSLLDILGTTSLDSPRDLWGLLPADVPERFTTLDLAAATGRPAFFAQRIAYCLRRSGAAREVGKSGNRRIYAREPDGDPALNHS